MLSQATVTLLKNSEETSYLKQGFLNCGGALQVVEGFSQRYTSLDTRLETSGSFLPPTEELGKPQLLFYWKIPLLSQLRDVYLIGTCDVPASCRPGKEGRGWSRAAGTCSCRLARSGCVPPRASSHSAGPCRGTGCHPWSGAQPEGKENIRKEGVEGWERGEVPRKASDSHCNQDGTMGMHRVHEWSYQESPPPAGLAINSHTMDHRNRGSHTVGINHDYFRDMQRRHHASRPAKVTCLAEL